MLFFKTPVVRIASLVFILIFVASIFHLVSNGIFVGAVAAFILVVAGYFFVWRLSPANAAARTLADPTRTSTLAAELPAGHGAVYLSRYGTAFLPGPMISASIQGTQASPTELRNASSTRWVLPAGEHTLTAAIPGTNAVSANIPATTTFTLAPGQTLYYLATTTMDLKRYTVHLTLDPDPTTAPARIAKTTLT